MIHKLQRGKEPLWGIAQFTFTRFSVASVRLMRKFLQARWVTVDSYQQHAVITGLASMIKKEVG